MLQHGAPALIIVSAYTNDNSIKKQYNKILNVQTDEFDAIRSKKVGIGSTKD